MAVQHSQIPKIHISIAIRRSGQKADLHLLEKHGSSPTQICSSRRSIDQTRKNWRNGSVAAHYQLAIVTRGMRAAIIMQPIR